MLLVDKDMVFLPKPCVPCGVPCSVRHCASSSSSAPGGFGGPGILCVSVCVYVGGRVGGYDHHPSMCIHESSLMKHMTASRVPEYFFLSPHPLQFLLGTA